jgi:hypothetical protein
MIVHNPNPEQNSNSLEALGFITLKFLSSQNLICFIHLLKDFFNEKRVIDRKQNKEKRHQIGVVIISRQSVDADARPTNSIGLRMSLFYFIH